MAQGDGRAGQNWGVYAAASAVMLGLIGLTLAFHVTNQHNRSAPTRLAAAGAWAVYFSPGGAAEARAGSGVPEGAVAEAIHRATSTVDMAAYDLDLEDVTRSLIGAAGRGLRVRLVTESDQAGREPVTAFEQAGIAVVQDGRPGLMHDKFLVVDGVDVWTGSMNFTFNGAYRNDNNLIRLHSADAAADFTREFEEMFIEDRFGPLSRPDTPYPAFDLDGTRVEVLFSPDDQVASHLISLIHSATQEIDFMVFSFTSEEIAQALVERHQAGVVVRGVLEADQVGSLSSQYGMLRQAGIEVRLDGNPATMHHKVLLVDDRVVATGSYNYSLSAETTNDENLLILYSAAAADLFGGEFERLFQGGLP